LNGSLRQEGGGEKALIVRSRAWSLEGKILLRTWKRTVRKIRIVVLGGEGERHERGDG